MRWIAIAAVAALAACSGDGGGECHYMGNDFPVGATWPAGDGCNTCHCDEVQGVQCSLVACADADPLAPACGPSGGCPSGPACGFACCVAGERCVDGACHCGNGGAACMPGDSCEAPGPIGGDACGSICCGVSGPCPQ